MSTPRIDVAYAAALARIDLTPAETAAFQEQLDKIVGHVRQLEAIDTSSVPDTPVDPSLPVNALRPDEPRPSLPREAVLANAPEHEDGEILMPKIVE
jgi:aspartyl-tRNA(Asn)/glutamyl-tRNA(Gln) amidotransferase subunit C